MNNKTFIIKQVTNDDFTKELELIGYDKSYAHKAVDKFNFRNLKVYGLTVPQANILKQLALSVGADCATNKNVITGVAERSDVILSGSFSQLRKIADKLKQQPFSLALLAESIEKQIFKKQTKTKIVGILNITKDSFSDGGKYYSTDKACEHFVKLISDGADVIDIGAESTRPGAPAIDSDTQLKSLLPVLKFANNNKFNIPISIDTRDSAVADECLRNGATFINDVSGLKYDLKMAETVAKHGAKLILQHSKGNEVNTSSGNSYKSLIDDVYIDLYNQLLIAKEHGIEDVIIDPGIGFDKDLKDNYKIIKRIDEFYSLQCPVMLGISRKSLLGLSEATNDEKDMYTLALNTLALEHNVDYIRVHNVRIHRKLLDIYQNFD